MLINIRHHCLVVARVANKILTGLTLFAPDHAQPDRQLVISAALLHDIAKTPCLEGKCNHAEVGGAICREHGYRHIASIVEQHVILHNFDSERYADGHFNAEDIIFYADKRVRHDKVVSLDERMDYIMERYGKGDPTREARIRKYFDQAVDMEHSLCSWLPYTAEELGLF